MDCPRPINVGSTSTIHVVVANQALHENTKVRRPGIEAKGVAQGCTLNLCLLLHATENR